MFEDPKAKWAVQVCTSLAQALLAASRQEFSLCRAYTREALELLTARCASCGQSYPWDSDE